MTTFVLGKRLLILLIFCAFVTRVAISAECASPPAKEIHLYLGSTRALLSPDQRWQFVIAATKSSDRNAALYIQDFHSSKKWNVGWLERDGTAFWSEDSKRLFLRDEYAADDTNIRVFDLTGSVPEEIRGLNRKIQTSIFAHIPKNKTTLWLYYPQVCFAANDSSTIIVTADAPLVPKRGDGSGKSFSVKLTIGLTPVTVVKSELGK